MRRRRIHIFMAVMLTAAATLAAPVRQAGAYPDVTGRESGAEAAKAEKESPKETVGEAVADEAEAGIMREETGGQADEAGAQEEESGEEDSIGKEDRPGTEDGGAGEEDSIGKEDGSGTEDGGAGEEDSIGKEDGSETEGVEAGNGTENNGTGAEKETPAKDENLPGTPSQPERPEPGTPSQAERPETGTPSQAERPETGTPSQAERPEPGTPSQAERPDIGTPSSAIQPRSLGGCGTIEELQQLLEDGETDRILVAADIVLEEDSYIRLEAETSVTIDMNGNRLIIPSGTNLEVSGPIRIEGDAPGRALIDAYGDLILREGAAVAAKGEACTAVLCRNTGGSLTTWDASVTGEGTKSRAIVWESGAECRLEYALITAKGTGSAAIVSETPVRLFLCKVMSEGDESIITGSEVCLDAAVASPLPDQAVVIRREAFPAGREEQNGICVVAGSDPQELYDRLLPQQQYAFYDPVSGEISPTYFFDVTWRGMPEDLSVPGNYMSECRPAPLRDWCGVSLPIQSVPIHVTNPDEPHIQEIFRMGNTVVFRYLTEIEGDELRLMYSMDKGGSWQDAAGIPGGRLNIDGHSAVLDGLEINRDYLFKIAVYGGAMEGESRPVPFYYYENDYDRWDHGDRDGDGREEREETLPDFVPHLFHGNSLWDSDGAEENLTGSSEKEDEALPAAGGNGIAAKEPETEDESQSHRAGTENGSVSFGTEDGGSEYGLPEESGGNETDQKAENQESRSGTAASDGPGPGSAACQATNIILTFRQFNDQLQVNENWITLTGDGIRVELPAAGLRELGLEEDEVFAACMERDSNDRFAVRFWAGEEEVKAFGEEGFLVELPWEGAVRYEKAVCRRTDGLEAQSELDDTGIRNKVFETGEYTIWLEGEKQRKEIPWSASAAGIFCCAAAALLGFWRRRRVMKEAGHDG